MTKPLVLSVMYIFHDRFCLIKSLSDVIVSHLVYDDKNPTCPPATSSALLRVHATQPYKAIGSISDMYNLILVSFLMFLFFQMLFKLLNTFKAVLILMSVEQSQFAIRVVPTYLNISTFCSSFLQNNSPSFILLFTVCSDFVLSNIHSVLESVISCPYFELTWSTLSKRTWACLSSCVKRLISSAKRKLLIVLPFTQIFIWSLSISRKPLCSVLITSISCKHFLLR